MLQAGYGDSANRLVGYCNLFVEVSAKLWEGAAEVVEGGEGGEIPAMEDQVAVMLWDVGVNLWEVADSWWGISKIIGYIQKSV
ncbi:MAG: hypothetical protein U0Z17_06370 [Bacteroidales bacterium]